MLLFLGVFSIQKLFLTRFCGFSQELRHISIPKIKTVKKLTRKWLKLTLCYSSKFILTKRNSVRLRAPVSITRFWIEFEIRWKLSQLPVDHKVDKFLKGRNKTFLFRVCFVAWYVFFVVPIVTGNVHTVQTPEVRAAWCWFFCSACFKVIKNYAFYAYTFFFTAFFKMCRFKNVEFWRLRIIQQPVFILKMNRISDFFLFYLCKPKWADLLDLLSLYT